VNSIIEALESRVNKSKGYERKTNTSINVLYSRAKID